MQKRALCFFLIAACHSASNKNAANTADAASAQIALAKSNAAIAAIRVAEDHRLATDPAITQNLSATGQITVIEAALTAAGRIGDPANLSAVSALLTHADANVRAHAAFALELIGNPSAGDAVAAQLAVEQNANAQGALARAAGALQAVSAQPILENLIATATSTVREDAARGWQSLVPLLGTSPNPATLSALFTCATTSSGRDAVACAWALWAANAQWKTLSASLTGPNYAGALTSGLRQEVLVPLLYASNHFSSSDLLPALQSLAADMHYGGAVRVTAVQELTDSASIEAALSDPSASVRVTALGQVPSVTAPAPTLVTQVNALLSDDSDWVQGQAIVALVTLDQDAARAAATSALASGGSQAQAGALSALALLATSADAAVLYGYLDSPTDALREAAANAITTLPAAAHPAAAHDQWLAVVNRAATDSLIDPFADAVLVATQMGWSDFSAPLVALYPAYSHWSSDGEGMVGRLNVLSGLAAFNDTADAALVQSAIADPLHLVEAQAATSYQTLTGTDLSAQVKLNNTVSTLTPSEDEIAAAAQSEVVIELAGGDVVLRMLPGAPVTAANFVGRVKHGFYDGLIFHRVVPAFVAQGGDPTGTGSGGAPHFVRDEISTYGHRRGTVGVATDGKDTGDCQFFFNLADNMYLDDSYTVFAEVEEGLDLVDGIQQGDAILTAYVID